MRPYRPGGLNAAMIDGGIGRKEIMARVDKRAEEKGKDFNKDNAYMRIADRWSSKGGALNIGALKGFQQRYEDKNPFLSSWNKAGVDGRTANYGGNGGRTGFGNWSDYLTGKDKSQHDLYRSGYEMLSGKGYAKGDTFTRLLDGSLRAAPRIGNTDYMNKFTGGFDKLGIKDLTGGTGTDGTDGTGTEEGTGSTEETNTGSGFTGGLNTAINDPNLGFQRKKSSMASSGRNRKGTSVAARSGFASGLSIK
jgi:hypothetical protein